MAERRDPRRPQQPIDRPVFHFDADRRGDDHDDNYYADNPPHKDHGDEPGHSDWGHEDERHVDHGDSADRLFDWLQALIQSVEDQLVTRQQRLENLVHERLAAVEREAGRVVRELGDRVHELGRRLDDATDGKPPSGPPPWDPPR